MQLGLIAVASLSCQENQQNRYIARLIRLEGKLSSLGRTQPIFCSAFSTGGAQQKSGGAHQNFFGRRFVPLHIQIASCATGNGDAFTYPAHNLFYIAFCTATFVLKQK